MTSDSPYFDRDGVTVWHGDCLDVLASLPDESVDAVVTDPPYALGYAGKEWDTGKSFVQRKAARANTFDHVGGNHNPVNSADAARTRRSENRKYGAWCEEWAAECYRILKPGGWFLAFGGTRTWHRLAAAVEDAGFEVRDNIAWLYGCHDDQTEVLTRRGWVNGLDLTEDDDVAQWATDGTISLVRPTARQRYDYDGPLVRFRNADVDQLVTPNHRVYLQTSDRAQVDGERRATWSDWQVKQAADVNRWQRMRLPAAGVHDGPGVGGTDYAALLGWVWAEGGFDPSGTGVRVYQSSTNAPLVDEIAALFDRLGAHKRYDYVREWKGRPYTATTWFITGDLARRVRADLPGKSPTYELLWRMTSDEKRALWDAAMKGDGSKAARTFWQKDRDALEWAQALLASIDCRGKVADDPRGALHWTARPTVELQARHLADASEDYVGEVWCVTVPSGAFIVRRNGRVSVSGNSGFPKSLDVAKALDATAGAERPIIGERVSAYGTNTATGERASRVDGGAGLWGGSEATVVPLRSTEPVTDLAREWEGWGTALKPAFEPIVVGRKPLAGTVASNITVHGVGALNIDGCRVGPAGGFGGGGKGSSGFGTGYERGTGFVESTKGRWPPNVAFDENTARTLDAQTSDLARNTTDAKPTLYDETGGASKAFPVFRYEPKAPQSERPLVNGILHPTVKPLGLIRWLTKLVTPPGGVVLEPFAGSGTTVEACLLEGFQCVAIEREPDYLPLIAQRVARHRDPIEATRLAGDDLGLFASLYDEDTPAQPDTPPTLL